ncbi:MAG TPA: type II secretion system protein, partial [Gemmatimonadaceae bacterium]|nr:type II secretion system protein [Gemmatimonadaceae bacterium]
MSTRRRLPRRAPRAARSRRAGMTLVEVIVSIVIMSGVLVGMAVFVANFARTNNENRLRARAGQLASQRLEEIKGVASYDSIETRYGGTESSIAGYAGFTRQTVVRRVGGAA